MSDTSKWRDVRDRAREVDPTWDDPERVARRATMRHDMIAAVSGAQLADLRKSLGFTQVQLAEAAGLSQARISQIEKGTEISLDSLRAYIVGLGGRLEVVAHVGDVHLDVA
jgi:DNA-binding XRE family transcriptional regulator